MVLKHTTSCDTASVLKTQISIQLPDGQLLSSNLHQYEHLSTVYEAAARKLAVPVERVRIKYTGKVLTQTETVNSLGILEGMVLKTEVITERSLSVKVAFPSHEIIHIDNLKNTDKVSIIMDRLAASSGKDTNLTLKVAGKELDRTKILYDLKLAEQTVVMAYPKKMKSSGACGVKHDEESFDVESIPEFNNEGKKVEVVFSFDTTGSMYSVLDKVRSKLAELVERLLHDIPDIRIGLIAHGDYCDYKNYVVQSHDLSSDTQSLTAFAMDVPKTGGGDAPEAYELVLHHAQTMDWSESSAKALVVIGDNIPHPPSMTEQDLYWHAELDILKGMNVKIYGVHALPNSYNQAEKFYRELADRTNGAYLTFSNFNLMQDMFLAVCYNETGDHHLEEYREKLEKQEDLSEQQLQDYGTMFDQLKIQQQALEDNKAAELENVTFDPQQSRNYIATPWFDRRLDDGTPTYFYKQSKDRWAPKSESSTCEHKVETPATRTLRPTPKPKSKRNAIQRFFSCLRSA